ncbi:uncharacterized protein OCT59_008282 [Rhizophagus irregularis]|uniref:uncharacterized protein n=1 Tax=Rhizophagus irregularis TaxID=588596 RepID=UPI001A01BF18|nr:hypothetical protein OCT59_008282 [Rhizophagus irregularis]GBC42577.2 hypothetical protein GLOIN_2v1772519 [Rhizophagus irregularis DAOM 181602=DAOM 197198]CAG8462624.1 4508_t:CDS:2 [Rhizophagus irregularis]
MNISNRRRDRGIVSPAPFIEVVGTRLKRNRIHSESPSRLSPAPPLPCNEDGNPGNPGNNTTTSSVQPPSYDDNQQSLNSMDGGPLWNLVML